MLLIGTGGDEELIFDVDEMLTSSDNLNVGIGNRVLYGLVTFDMIFGMIELPQWLRHCSTQYNFLRVG